MPSVSWAKLSRRSNGTADEPMVNDSESHEKGHGLMATLQEQPRKALRKARPANVINAVKSTAKVFESVKSSTMAESTGGLLVSQPGRLTSHKFLFAIFMEFLGVLLFSLFGNSATPEFAPAGNGLTLAVLIYITANVSGGHLNPAVTIATLITGHISWIKGALYILVQIVGGMMGSLLTAGLVPQLNVGTPAVACFKPGEGVSRAQIFGWELTMTFMLVSAVYAVAIGKPSFGNIGPLIVGASLWAAANCAGSYTGAALNPARALGPAAVFHCSGEIWIYVLAEFTAGIVAGLLSWPLYGTGEEFGRHIDAEFDMTPDDDPDEVDMEAEHEENEERMSNVRRAVGSKSADPAVMQDVADTERPGSPSPPIADAV